ncbi:MAG: sensor histidine kinase, partial [Dorea sp.]|nr:sensor histidine kinase [Dorea sp.]
LMEEVVEEQELKRQSELDALQSQINPHFLYNTLDSVIWMIEDEQNDGAVYMIKELSKLLRISINKGSSLITIRDEIRHAESYMNIQKLRYKDQFTCQFQIDEEILDCCTIKLVVQPLIENAINYGVQGMYDDGEILVRGYRQGNHVYLEVSDNGCGMSEEQIENVFRDTTKEAVIPSNAPEKKGNGVGLRNVNTRIQMQFGQEYGIQIFSELGEGTTMRIHLPYLSYQKAMESMGRKV